jgi:4-oxalocrotonate tautomerase
MPYVNLKIVKEQVSQKQKKQLVDGLMDIIVNIMHRNRDLTVITVDELDCTNWIIGGNSLDQTYNKHGKVACVTIYISKGTSNQEEMAKVIQSGKELIGKVLGSNDLTNYFIIHELNPDSWGFDGISMTIRNKQELEKNK